MDDECKSQCISAGMMLLRAAEAYKPVKSTPVIFRDNVITRKDVLTVPHSELAMHVGAAGKDILAWCTTEMYAHIVFDDGCGCTYTHGLIDEVLQPGLARITKERWGPSRGE